MRRLHKIVLLSVIFLSSNGFCDLLWVSSTQSYNILYDLTNFSGTPENLVAYDQYYSQGLSIYFSNTNDATWAEVIIPNGSSYPLVKYTKEQNPSIFQNWTNAVSISNSVLLFRDGASFASRSEMNQFLPANQYVTVRFGGGSLGTCEDQLLIADSSNFFDSPPQLNVASNTLNQLMKFDPTQDFQCSVTSTTPWQLRIGDSKYISIYSIWPLQSNYSLIVPRNLLQPGLVYEAFFYTGTGELYATNSFAGFTRPVSDSHPIASSGALFGKSYFFQTRGPALRFKQASASSLSNQVTRMNVEIESNPNYDGVLEFTESLAGTPVWTSMTNIISFGTNGLGTVTLEKSGDLRNMWDKRLFLRVRNSRQPIETPGFIPAP